MHLYDKLVTTILKIFLISEIIMVYRVTIIAFLLICILFFWNIYDKDSLILAHSYVQDCFATKPHPLVTVLGILGTLMGISLPISINMASRTSDLYDDGEIKNAFLNEKDYKRLRRFILPLIVFTMAFAAFNVFHYWLFNLILLICYVVAIYLFYEFIKLVEEYATNFENYYLEKIQKEADEILGQKK